MESDCCGAKVKTCAKQNIELIDWAEDPPDIEYICEECGCPCRIVNKEENEPCNPKKKEKRRKG